jgi:hypothetical protein
MEAAMKKMSLLAALLLMPALVRAEKYSVRDEGDFAPAGHRVEFADRFGWRSYHIDFDFGIDEGSRSLSRDSRLKILVKKRDGSEWNYVCRTKGSALGANINYVFNHGISVVAECRIPEKEFAKAVDLHPEDVGLPNLVFQAWIRDGQVHPGAQRGLYFVAGGQIESSTLNAYASAENDPSNLAVVFRSN